MNIIISLILSSQAGEIHVYFISVCSYGDRGQITRKRKVINVTKEYIIHCFCHRILCEEYYA
jgi:hypothetical protein